MSNIIKTAAILFFSAALFSACSKSDYTPPATDTKPASYLHNFSDSFYTDTNGWSRFDTATLTNITVGNGYLVYNFDPKTPIIGLDAIQTGCPLTTDFEIKTSIKSDNVMGIVFGVSDTSNGYAFLIDNYGSFAVYYEGDNLHKAGPVLDWSKSSTIIPGAFNQVELDQTGDLWIGYINGTKVFQTTTKKLLGTKIGYIVKYGTNGTADYLHVGWQ